MRWERSARGRLWRAVWFAPLAVALFLGGGVSGAAASAAASNVRAVQEALAARGYDAGAVDGIWGPQTEQAIRAFEGDRGWRQTGALTDRLLRALQPPRDLAPIVLRPPPSVVAERQSETNPPPAGTVVNRNWLIRDVRADGLPVGKPFSLFLEADGKVAGPRFASRMRWDQAAGRLTIRYDSAIGTSVERSGRFVDADRIAGEAHGPDGAVWQWTAEARAAE